MHADKTDNTDRQSRIKGNIRNISIIRINRSISILNMKIGIDIRLYGTRHGGIGRYCKELLPRILKLGSQHEYFLFYNKNNIDQDELDGLSGFADKHHLIQSSARHYSFGEQTSFLRQLNKYNLDLVHFPNFNFPIFYKRSFVVTIHDMVHHKISGAKKSHILHFLAYKKVIATAAKNAKEIITVSEASKKDIVNLLQVPPEKVKVIYEGTSLKTNVSEVVVTEIKKRYLLNRPYFLFVGVMERKKNLVNLTRGFDFFLQKYKLNMDLVIVGKTDSHYPEIKHSAMDINHASRLIFTGQVEELELAALYKGAYAYTTASLHEGFGLPGVEALSFGLPLLTSNIAVFNEIYDNAALYFNPLDPSDIGEKMQIIARDPQFYEQLSRKSLERAQFFDWEKAARETLEVYQEHPIILSS